MAATDGLGLPRLPVPQGVGGLDQEYSGALAKVQRATTGLPSDRANSSANSPGGVSGFFVKVASPTLSSKVCRA